MKLRMCRCAYCRRGAKTKHWRYTIRHMRSACRSVVRRNIRKGDYDHLPEVVSVPYIG